MTTLGTGSNASAMRAKGHTCEARPVGGCAQCLKDGAKRRRLVPLSAFAKLSATYPPIPGSFAELVRAAPRTVFPPAQKGKAA